MKVSLNELIKMNACVGGIERFIKQTGANGDEPHDVASLVGGINIYEDLLWLAGKKLTKERIVRFACDCALINIDKIKPYCESSDFSIIVEFLNNPTDVNAYAAACVAADAAIDADADAYAAYAAADAAYAAVDADSTVDAAAYAYDAAADTTDAAYADAADAVNNLLIEMFNEH